MLAPGWEQAAAAATECAIVFQICPRHDKNSARRQSARSGGSDSSGALLMYHVVSHHELLARNTMAHSVSTQAVGQAQGDGALSTRGIESLQRIRAIDTKQVTVVRACAARFGSRHRTAGLPLRFRIG